MATTVTSNSHYAGKDAGKIMRKSIKAAKTLESGFVSLNENVNFKLYLRKAITGDGTRRYSCSFEPDGSVDLTDKAVEPIKFKDDFKVCKDTFRNQWNGGDLGESAWNDGDMKPIMDAILADKLARKAKKLEKDIWQGDSSNVKEFDGFIKQFEADADIITVDGTTITKDNVEAEFMKALGAIPTDIDDEPIRLGVASNVMTAYSFLLISRGINNGLGGNANTELKFGKFILQELPGLPANNMVVADPENLVFATGLKGDHNDIRLVDTSETLLDGNIIGSMVYNAGTGYYFGDEIVWYRPEEAPSV